MRNEPVLERVKTAGSDATVLRSYREPFTEENSFRDGAVVARKSVPCHLLGVAVRKLTRPASSHAPMSFSVLAVKASFTLSMSFFAVKCIGACNSLAFSRRRN
jgi:hypothetical protein